MPLGSTSPAFKAAVESTAYQRAVKVTVTFPVIGAVTFGVAPFGCIQALEFEEGDQSSYPSDLINQSGLTNMAGSVTLGGSIVIGGVATTVTRLFNPNDALSPVYQQTLTDAPITVSAGVVELNSDGSTTTELVDRSGFVTTIETQQSNGLVVVNFADVPPGFDALPELEAVLVAPPFNAGLTSEFVIDRIARAASNGAVSSWPAQGAGCVLAVGFRSSIWPEVGTLDTADYTSGFLFQPGVNGTALYAPNLPFGSPTVLPYLPAAAIGTAYGFDFWASSLPAVGTVDLTVGATSSLSADCVQTTIAQALVSVTFKASNGVTWTWSQSVPTATSHRVSAALTLPTIGSSVVTGTVWVDGTGYTVTTTAVSGSRSANYGHVTVDTHAAAGIEGLRVTTVASPTFPAFTPTAVLDPSLNPLQAVPAIAAGANGYDELQTIAEAELGWIGFRDGVLTFLNRDTIAGQASSRTVTAQASLMDIESSTVGASTLYDDIAIDYTEYEFGDTAMVYTPKKALKVPAHSTLTITRTLPDSLTVGEVDQSFIYQFADTSNPGVNQSVFRASADINGVNEIPDTSQLSGTVTAVTPSQIRIALTNRSGAAMFMVSSSNYTAIPAGTPSVWINGLPVTPDDASIVHVNGGTQTSTYQVPSNGYRQDRDATITTGNRLLAMLSSPTVLYGQVDMVPDPRVTIPDRVRLDIPVDGGVSATDVYVWGNTVSAQFDADSASWSQQLDVRAITAPGAWVLGESVLGTDTFIY